MPRWVLQCPNCKTEFQRSQISDVGMARYFDPPKPKIPPAGVECVCPNSGTRLSTFVPTSDIGQTKWFIERGHFFSAQSPLRQ
jgi:hypothetical protein